MPNCRSSACASSYKTRSELLTSRRQALPGSRARLHRSHAVATCARLLTRGMCGSGTAALLLLQDADGSGAVLLRCCSAGSAYASACPRLSSLGARINASPECSPGLEDTLREEYDRMSAEEVCGREQGRGEVPCTTSFMWPKNHARGKAQESHVLLCYYA